jgi:hypothetical protein
MRSCVPPEDELIIIRIRNTFKRDAQGWLDLKKGTLTDRCVETVIVLIDEQIKADAVNRNGTVLSDLVLEEN